MSDCNNCHKPILENTLEHTWYCKCYGGKFLNLNKDECDLIISLLKEEVEYRFDGIAKNILEKIGEKK